MKTFSSKSGLAFFAISMFAFFFSSCTKQGIVDEILPAKQNPDVHAEKLGPYEFITTSPTLAGKTFLFQRVSQCNAYNNMVSNSAGKLLYSGTLPFGVKGIQDASGVNFIFNLNEWVFITPPNTPGPQPPVNKVLKFRYTSNLFDTNATFTFNRNTGLWTIPASNGTWEATQINPSAPC